MSDTTPKLPRISTIPRTFKPPGEKQGEEKHLYLQDFPSIKYQKKSQQRYNNPSLLTISSHPSMASTGASSSAMSLPKEARLGETFVVEKGTRLYPQLQESTTLAQDPSAQKNNLPGNYNVVLTSPTKTVAGYKPTYQSRLSRPTGAVASTMSSTGYGVKTGSQLVMDHSDDTELNYLRNAAADTHRQQHQQHIKYSTSMSSSLTRGSFQSIKSSEVKLPTLTGHGQIITTTHFPANSPKFHTSLENTTTTLSDCRSNIQPNSQR